MEYKTYTKNELIKTIKEDTYILGDSSINPYKNADVSLKKFNPFNLVPSTYYYFYDYVINLVKLYEDFLKDGIDIFNLDGYVSFFNKEYEKQLALTPPIIEKVDNKDMILDGMHRIVTAKFLKKNINCIYIENSDKNYLPYAVPNKNGWDDVQVFKNKVPDNFITRGKRYKENYRWYSRQFNLDGETQIPRQHTLKRDENYKKLLEQDVLRKQQEKIK